MNILHNISRLDEDSPDLLTHLKTLGDELRSEQVREQLGQEPTFFIEQCCRFMKSEEVAMETVRILVNFTADSDQNRLVVTENEQLMSIIESNLGGGSPFNLRLRYAILLSQFIRNTELQATFMNTFYDFGIADALFDALDQDSQLLDIQLEIEAAIVSSAIDKIIVDSNWQRKAIEWTQKLVEIYQTQLQAGDDSMILESVSSLLYNLTKFESDPGFNNTNISTDILKLLPKVPAIENETMIRRRLFGACGNISSMNGYDNKKTLSTMITLFLDSEDPYSAGACAVNLGNTINGAETKSNFFFFFYLKDFLDKFFSILFNDVIQFQALHVLNNLMTESMSKIILEDHYQALLRISKVIIDNAQYYREVLAIYLKFLTKLVRSLSLQLASYQDLWFDVERCDSPIDVGILFALIGLTEYLNGRFDSSHFHNTLMKHLMSFLPEAPAIYYDEKVKCLGIFLVKIGIDKLNYDDYAKLLSSFANRDFLGNSVVANNLKFVAAKTLETGNSKEELGDLEAICRKIIAGLNGN